MTPPPIAWPGGARCAVMMTFDLDGESPWIQRDPALAERPLHMSMGAYGPQTRIARFPALCEEIVTRGHEVGHHGYLHEKPFFMKSREEEEELLVKSLQIFKKILGGTPLGGRVACADPGRHSW